jgi:tetratricopeptide (TPR) repeat protein
MDEASQTTLEQARQALGRGQWQEAYGLLAGADAGQALSGQALVLLAETAYGAGHLDATIDAWERAHAEGVGAGDPLSAAGAAVRVAMHLVMDTGLLSPVRGWLKRAERLLEGHDDTPVHAWLAVAHNYERLLSGDFQKAREWAERAIEVGGRHDLAAAAIGRVAKARSLIFDGNVSEGVGLLEEAAVAAVSGEIDPLSTGIVYCEVVCAFQALAQYERAEQWTVAMERWRRGRPVGSMHGRCRIHRAEILRLRGACHEAEQEALAACEELRPYLRREFGWPLTELGSIRLRMGDVAGAEEAFLAAHAAGWDPQPGLALVQLARGDLVQASASVRDALEHPLSIPSKELPPNTELRRAPLLDAQVTIAVAAGDVETARAAAEELSRIAAAFGGKALAATAALGRGKTALAAGESAKALREFEAAAQLWSDVGAPYETAVAQLGLARAYRAEGNEGRARLEMEAARSGFERVGAVHLASEAALACAANAQGALAVQRPEARSSPATQADAPENCVFRREGDHWLLAFDGRSVRLRDLKGIRHLARLLAEPGRHLHVLELVAGERDDAAGEPPHAVSDARAFGFSDAGVLLDEKAKLAYRRRLVEIEEDIREAQTMGDTVRAAQACAEREFLVRELARAVGLGGRDRRALSTSERARVSVTRSIRQAMARIRKHAPALGEHLERAIRTGTYCAYLPDPRTPPSWAL